MSDLFDWSEQANHAEPAKPTEATILPFRIHRHVGIERMAQRLARYDGKRAAFFLRSEAEKIVRIRVEKGYPEHIAEHLAFQYESAVIRRLEVLWGYTGDAAS
jgi:hypothetical protein